MKIKVLGFSGEKGHQTQEKSTNTPLVTKNNQIQTKFKYTKLAIM